jgi:hypothetical protein
MNNLHEKFKLEKDNRTQNNVFWVKILSKSRIDFKKHFNGFIQNQFDLW